MFRFNPPVSKIFVFAIIFSATQEYKANAGGLGCINPKDSRCKLSEKVIDVEKSCFEVECETISIPKVVFPWQTGNGLFGLGIFNCGQSACDSCDASSCDGQACEAGIHNGAFTKTVKVLSKKKYTVPGKEYSWSVQEGACDGGCDADSASNKIGSHVPSVAELHIPQPVVNLAPVQVR